MSEEKGARWLLVLGGLGVAALVAGLFVVMASGDGGATPRDTPRPIEEEGRVAAPGSPQNPAAAGKPQPLPSDTPAPQHPPSKPIIYDQSGQPPPDPAKVHPVASPTKNTLYKNVTPALTACSTAGGGGPPREQVTVGFTIVAEAGKVKIENVTVSEGDGITPAERDCVRKAFESQTFDSPEGQENGRFPVTFAFSMP